MAADTSLPPENHPAPGADASLPSPQIHFHKNGIKESAGRYQGGKQEGRWTYWDAEGHKLSEGDYQDGLQEGLWTTWYPSGQVQQECHCQRGSRHGPWSRWFADGTKAEETCFEDGNLHGSWKSWHPSGKPKVAAHYRHGSLHGPWTDWTQEGAVRAQTHFVHGVPLGWAFRGDPDQAPARMGILGYLFWFAFVGVAALAVYREMFVLVAVLVFLLALTIHEAGHFVAAKLVGIPIERFAIGIGPRLCSFQLGTTHYELNLFPVLGFVLPYFMRPNELAHWHAARRAWRRGEPLPPDPEVSTDPLRPTSELVSRPRRFIFLAGGLTCNFLSAVLFLWGYLLLDAGHRQTPLSVTDAALEAPQLAAKMAWTITRFLPAAILESLKPSNLNKPGALATISEDMSRQSRTRVKAKAHEPAARLNVARPLFMHLALFNIVLFCFNLLPIPPLDGFRCLRLGVEMTLRRDLPDRYLMPLVVMGILLLVLLLLTAVYGMIRDLIVAAFS